MFRLSGSYLEFNGFNLDGGGNALDGFYCNHYHHQRFIGNSVSNTGGAGIATVNCDYLTADHNVIYHNGYMPSETDVPQYYGWTSGISYNSVQWFDNYAGLHNIIANNVIVGEYDGSSHHTDGNGIILDLSSGSYDASTANTPPALVINNVVYGNGGRCVNAYVVTNFWIVNNTCYTNGLDPALGPAGEITANNSANGYFINNISAASSAGDPTYKQGGTNVNIQYYANLYSGSLPNVSSSQIFPGDPEFLSPVTLSLGGFREAPPPSLLNAGLTLQGGSPAIGQGIDPSALPGLPSAIVNDLQTYIYTDIKGKPRSQGAGADLGAYQH